MFRHQQKFVYVEILKHVYSGGHFKKWPPLRSKVKFAYLLLSFFVIFGPENVYLDTKIIFPSDLETEILIHGRH